MRRNVLRPPTLSLFVSSTSEEEVWRSGTDPFARHRRPSLADWSAPVVVKGVTFWRRYFMADLYTCSCGNRTWEIFDMGVRCKACQKEYVALHTPVKEFNSAVTEELEEELAE
jgi:hypothetical protein